MESADDTKDFHQQGKELCSIFVMLTSNNNALLDNTAENADHVQDILDSPGIVLLHVIVTTKGYYCLEMQLLVS